MEQQTDYDFWLGRVFEARFKLRREFEEADSVCSEWFNAYHDVVWTEEENAQQLALYDILYTVARAKYLAVKLVEDKFGATLGFSERADMRALKYYPELNTFDWEDGEHLDAHCLHELRTRRPAEKSAAH